MSNVFGRSSSQLGRILGAASTARAVPPAGGCGKRLAIGQNDARSSTSGHRKFSSKQRPQFYTPVHPQFSTSQKQRDDNYREKAKDLNQKSLDDHEKEVRLREHQVKRPWHRQDADKPPAELDADEDPPTKGKLLTTPTRLLKLILPLPMRVEKDEGNNGKGTEYARSLSSNEKIQPLALLVHSQQPLSYVERLIQAELPPVVENGKEKIPNIYFRAEDTGTNDEKPAAKDKEQGTGDKSHTPGKHVASYSGLGHEGPDRAHKEKRWVRWSSSTEMGDFIRDAARGREFAIEIEGYDVEMRVGVPSFSDRTFYMRDRLRRMSRTIDSQTAIKRECDELAHKGAHRLAQGGFALLAGWWGIVYYVTFHTEFGWDLVEPVTYLAGLATIMAGYLWFLYISRDLSYKAALKITVSHRQNALYEARGFDLHRWEQLVQEANALRREIKTVADEYDVDWDETRDVGEEVKEVLDKEKRRSRKQMKNSEDEDDDDDDGDEAKGEGKKSAPEEKKDKN